MASTSNFKNGFSFLMKSQLYKIVEFMHVKPGKGPAFVRTKLRNIRTGQVVDKTFRAGEKVEEIRIETKKMQYLYSDDAGYHFMDIVTYDQIQLIKNNVEDVVDFLAENQQVKIQFYGTEIIGIELPASIEAKIIETDPGLKGDTAQGGTKPAKLETGAVVQVPLFIQQGESIKVDTRSGEYLERVKT